ncbi:toll/interleukin-1 receptor domain-containing protein [Mediterraneibacter sp. 210702-DFI.5.30]|uniref:toll/interleukin-1 receptor domain-containing protein n=1 Tax=Mediterraneibacter sp. 210702-DFI.5.30 TaxID=2883232 RepID=UPI001D073E0B|nr:toll/interleukin-1 receptor domain-containing protein [Mediterraneibacter sp. 210702-DFI.5.30]MCB6621518.1 TIR domain-containing protein [Mediterraneibacter sp. 210702-DFI.5.30]
MDGILQKKNKAFISWSENKARTCADFLSDLLNKIFEENEIVFCSRQITDGRMWIQEIDKALKESKIGIILVTREDISRPWLNFEAGALYTHRSMILLLFLYLLMLIIRIELRNIH